MFKYQTDWQFPIYCQHQNIQIWDEAHHRDSWISYITIDADNMMWTLTKVENKGKSNRNLAHNVIVSMGKMIKNFFWIWKINPLARPRSLNHSVPIYRQTVCTTLQTLHNFCLHFTRLQPWFWSSLLIPTILFFNYPLEPDLDWETFPFTVLIWHIDSNHRLTVNFFNFDDNHK